MNEKNPFLLISLGSNFTLALDRRLSWLNRFLKVLKVILLFPYLIENRPDILFY